MRSGMVHSQFESLEEPEHESDVLKIDVDVAPEEVQRRALETVKEKLKEFEGEDADDENKEGGEK